MKRIQLENARHIWVVRLLVLVVLEIESMPCASQASALPLQPCPEHRHTCFKNTSQKGVFFCLTRTIDSTKALNILIPILNIT
jgi:hypothetical protein